jgi:hypothetical protein
MKFKATKISNEQATNFKQYYHYLTPNKHTKAK